MENNKGCRKSMDSIMTEMSKILYEGDEPEKIEMSNGTISYFRAKCDELMLNYSGKRNEGYYETLCGMRIAPNEELKDDYVCIVTRRGKRVYKQIPIEIKERSDAE